MGGLRSGPIRRLAVLAILAATFASGCGGREDDSALVLRVGPPSEGATVEAAAEVVRARLAGLEVEGTVAIDGDRLSLDVPPAEPGSGLVTLLTDPRSLRILIVPTGVPPDADAVDLSWEPLLDASGPVPTAIEEDALGVPALTFRFAGGDAERLGAHTSTHTGEALAFVFGDEVVAVPVIQSPIKDGRLTLTLVGDQWPLDSLQELAALVSSGPLPAPLVEEAGG